VTLEAIVHPAEPAVDRSSAEVRRPARAALRAFGPSAATCPRSVDEPPAAWAGSIGGGVSVRSAGAAASTTCRRAAFAERVRLLRARTGLTPTEVAVRAGLQPAFYADVETGLADLNQLAVERLDRLALAMDIDLLDLLDGVARPVPAVAPQELIADVVPRLQLDLWVADKGLIDVDMHHRSGDRRLRLPEASTRPKANPASGVAVRRLPVTEAAGPQKCRHLFPAGRSRR
jgi:transcriptional regulator with XRE-family HTH domain